MRVCACACVCVRVGVYRVVLVSARERALVRVYVGICIRFFYACVCYGRPMSVQCVYAHVCLRLSVSNDAAISTNGYASFFLVCVCLPHVVSDPFWR